MGEAGASGGFVRGPDVIPEIDPDDRQAGVLAQDHVETIREGTDLKNRHPEISPLLQVMPWPVYGKMTTCDLRAVYEFLKAIPAHEGCIPLGN